MNLIRCVLFVILVKYCQQTVGESPQRLLLNSGSPVYKGSENFPSAEQETPAQNILDNFVLDKPEEALAKKSFTVSEHAVLVLDGSLQNPRSLDGSCIFEEIKRAMSQMMKSCRVGMVHRCSYAAVTYSCSSKVEFDFLSDALAIKKLKSVPYPGGSCRRTDKGLETAANLFKVSGPSRTRRIVFLVTDGQSDDQRKTLESAKRLKRLNVEIFIITIGMMGKNAINEMANVASHPPKNYVFRVEKKNHFEYVFQPASQKIDPNKYQARKSLKYHCNYYYIMY